MEAHSVFCFGNMEVLKGNTDDPVKLKCIGKEGERKMHGGDFMEWWRHDV